MKIFTNDHISAIERVTCESQKIGEDELVRRTAERIVSEITQRWRPSRQTVIFAGPGSNGADALTAGRLLIEQGFRPSIFLFNINSIKISPLCRQCRDELLRACPDADFTEVVRDFHLPDLNAQSLVIDGLFGRGLKAPLDGGFKTLVQYINESKATVVAIDLPSGLFPDWNPHSLARNIIHASLTLTVQMPHLAFFFAENAPLVGEWKILDIGLSHDAAQSTPTPFHFVEAQEVYPLLRPRPDFCSKADFGTALLVAGSQGMMGAAAFAARGALRSGVGRLVMHVPQCGVPIAQTLVPEAMCRADASQSFNTDFTPSCPYDAIAVGPGIGTANPTIAGLEKLLKSSERPLLLDADALNCIAESPSLLDHIPKLSVITPHAGEFDRIFGAHAGDEARLHKAIEMSRHYNILIVLKGRYTALVRPDGKVYFNSSGSPALATAGAGDVLTGVIASFMAQGYKPEVSALIGVFVHGRAGEIAGAQHGVYGALATDIADCVALAIKDLMKI